MRKGSVSCLLALFLIACSTPTADETVVPTATADATATETPTGTPTVAVRPSPTVTIRPSSTQPPPTKTLIPTSTVRGEEEATETPTAESAPSATPRPTSSECVVDDPRGSAGRWVAPGTPFGELGLAVRGDCRIFYRRAEADAWQELGSTAGYPAVSSEEFGSIPLDLEGEYEIRSSQGERLWGFGVARPD